MQYFDLNEVNKGRKMVLSIIIVFLLLELLGFLWTFFEEPASNFFQSIVYLGIAGVFAYLFYKGYRWMEYIILLMFVLDLLEVLFYLLHLAGILEVFGGGFMLVLTLLVAGLGGFWIGGSESIAAFLKYQKQNRQ